MKYVKDCIMLKVSTTSTGNVNPNCSTLTNAEKCRKYREKKKSKDDEYAKKEKIRQQENRKRRTTKQIENDRIKSKIRMRRLRERRKKEKEPEMELKLNVSNLSNSNKEQRKKWRKAKQKYRKFLFDRNKDDIYEGKNLEESNSGDNGKQLNEKFGKGRSFYENVSPADTSHYKNRSLRFEGDVNLSQGSGTKFDDTEKTYGSTSSESGSYVIGTDKGSASEDEDVKLILQDKIPSINNLYSISDLLEENLRNSKHSDSSLSITMSTHDEDTSNSDNNALVEDTSLPDIEDRNLCSTDDLYCPTESSKKITRTVTECSTVYASPWSSISLYPYKQFFSSQPQQRCPIIQRHQEVKDYNTKNRVPQVPRGGSLNSISNLLPTFLYQPEIVSRQQTNNSSLHIPFTNQTAGELPALKTNQILPALGTSQGGRYWQNLPHVEGIKINDQRYSYGPQDETRDHYQLNEFPKQTRCPQTGNLPIPRQVLTPAITEDRMKYSRNNRNETCTASLVSSFSIKRNLPAGAWINSCCIIPGRRLLLIDCFNRCIYICGIDGTDVNSIYVDYNPLCVTLYDKNKALVSAGCEWIAVINLTSLKTDIMIKVKGSCYYITSIDDKICVVTGYRTLTMIDINGNVLKVINTSFYPRDICINKAGDIYYTSVHDNSVYFVTSEREERKIHSSPDLRDAIGLTADNNGDVYVAGFKSNNIHKISSDGKQHRIILTENDGIKSPRRLSYNNETNELAVICGFIGSDNESIKIYKVK